MQTNLHERLSWNKQFIYFVTVAKSEMSKRDQLLLQSSGFRAKVVGLKIFSAGIGIISSTYLAGKYNWGRLLKTHKQTENYLILMPTV